MARRLFKATMEVTVCFEQDDALLHDDLELSDSVLIAGKLEMAEQLDTASGILEITVEGIDSAAAIPNGWAQCYPWFGDGLRTVGQIIEAREKERCVGDPD